ncbi:hypothetical protein C2S51_006834 [Perilla frutescens var. frutescens]|nr:hypothetical protein C2S51_006834 [Perilla frutescens var. frutescens]
MAGRARVNNKSQWDGRIPPECESKPQIVGLNNELLWEEAEEPLHEGISLSNCSNSYEASGIGPGMPFSNSLLKKDPWFGVIGLVPCAAGGTGIIQWSRGSCHYNRMLRRVRGRGETDAEDNQNADLYKTRLERFFTDLRSDLLSPLLPIIQVALASGGEPSLRDKVRKAQLSTSLPNVKCVDAAGSELIGVDRSCLMFLDCEFS